MAWITDSFAPLLYSPGLTFARTAFAVALLVAVPLALVAVPLWIIARRLGFSRGASAALIIAGGIPGLNLLALWYVALAVPKRACEPQSQRESVS